MKRPLLLVAFVLMLVAAAWARQTGPGRHLGSRVNKELAPPVAAPTPPAPLPFEVRMLSPGFEYGHYRLPMPSPLGDRLVRFVRLDPTKVEFDIGAAGLTDKRIRTASAWADSASITVAVINASMFQDDWLSSVGYLRVSGKVQNARWASQQNAVLALHSKTGVATLFNLGCSDKGAMDRTYATLVQSIRMIGCDGKNVWAQEKRAWSSALIGADRQGRLLFLHVRSPYTMHDLVDQLLASPLDLTGLHYGEGGPEASLYVRGPDFEETNVGSFETGFEENDDNDKEWELPNVVVARTR